MTDLRSNPDALPDANPAQAGLHPVNGTTLYAEVRGSGPPLLLIHGGSEDAEEWRPLAECLTDFKVVTYDRRGTLRSGREQWPGKGSAQHADDAAGLLDALDLDEAIVFGGSSGGIVALELALRHPGRVRKALVWEPANLCQVPGGADLHRRLREAATHHLASHPDDWAGAFEAFGRALAPARPESPPQAQDAEGTEPDWYARREAHNAATFVADDLAILSREIVDEERLADANVDIRFSYGAETLAIFRDVASRLARVRGHEPDAVDGASHSAYLYPDLVADYIQALSPGSG
jgi:pimeloyl-ACP methyl ester carboxylesterase